MKKTRVHGVSESNYTEKTDEWNQETHLWLFYSVTDEEKSSKCSVSRALEPVGPQISSPTSFI